MHQDTARADLVAHASSRNFTLMGSLSLIIVLGTTVKPLITDSPSNGQPPYNGLMSWHRLLLPYI